MTVFFSINHSLFFIFETLTVLQTTHLKTVSPVANPRSALTLSCFNGGLVSL